MIVPPSEGGISLLRGGVFERDAIFKGPGASIRGEMNKYKANKEKRGYSYFIIKLWINGS